MTSLTLQRLKQIAIIFFAIFHFTICANTSNIRFFENKGQWKCKEKYKTQAGNNNIYFSENSITYNLIDEKALIEIEHEKKSLNSTSIKAHALRIDFLNANRNIELIPLNKRPEVFNYFIGNDKTSWKTDVKVYDKLQYKNVYNGIDLYYYGNCFN